MTFEVRVEHQDGSSTTIPHVGSRETDEFGRQSKIEIVVDRSDANTAALEQGDDEIYLEENGTDVYGGVLRDVERQKGKAKLLVDSFEQYAIDADRSSAQDERTGTDKALVEQAINDVSELSIGTVEQTASGLTIIAHLASPARVIRQVRNVAGGEILYKPDKSVDYQDTLGSDKTGTTLAPRKQNVEDFTAHRKTADRATHLTCVGAGSGDAQLTSSATATNYSSGSDRKVNRVYKDTEVVEQSTLDNICQIVVDEMYGGRTEAKGLVYDEDISLGDKYHVEYPEHNVDTDLSVVKYTHIRDSQGERTNVTLADQRFVEGDRDKEIRENVGRYVRGETRMGLGEYGNPTNAPAIQNQGGYLIWVDGSVQQYPAGVYAFRPGSGYDRVVDTDDIRWHGYEYGDLSDGDKTVTSNETLSGVKFYNTLDIQSGNTLTVGGDGVFIAYADDAIIEGTIDGSGTDGGGGAGGVSAASLGGGTGGDGAAGADGGYCPSAAGGSGQTGATVDPYAGGDGGDGGSAPNSEAARKHYRTGLPTPEITPTVSLQTRAGASGGGGGGEGEDLDSGSNNTLGGSGGAPGGGGGGAVVDGEVSGGDGGEGGCTVVIIAKTIRGTGTVTVEGGRGQFGDNFTNPGGHTDHGGGGGGGSGGAIIMITDDMSDWGSRTHNITKGQGATPVNAGDGADGEDGYIYGFDRDTRTRYTST